MEVTGKITKILEKETGKKKDGSGDWVKQLFLLETTEQFNNLYCFEVFGDEKVDNLNKYNKVGDEVKVDFNVSTNEWKGKYFTSLSAWKIFKAESAPDVPLPPVTDLKDGDPDDLPF